LNGNIFIDFLNGAGVLPLGHGHPELVQEVVGQLGAFIHGLDFPTPAKDAFTEAQFGSSATAPLSFTTCATSGTTSPESIKQARTSVMTSSTTPPT
jgi:diaminobutyrate-2-oxoglutarate transaminase